MTTGQPDRDAGTSGMSLQARLTSAFVTRQFVLLTLIAVLFFVVLFFFDYFKYDWDFFWDELPLVDFKYLPPLPAIVVLVFGYTYLIGVLFALVPSERSFQFFFNGILTALFVLNYDHSVIDWLFLSVGGTARESNPVSLFKIIASCALLSAVIVMHYNILSDDFTRRMIRRGIPTEEAARIRPGMVASLLPLLFACGVVAAVLGVIGEFSALIFGAQRGLFPKMEIVLLGGIGIGIAYVLRSIIKELYQSGGRDEEETPEAGPEGDVAAGPADEAAPETPNG
ncbi:MAG: hypothetical protein HYT80_09060 [Euryarchaeota archaeon]|nr:hypothetical protein [Euryarchaeota archaeon]